MLTSLFKKKEGSELSRWDEMKNTDKVTKVKPLISYDFLHYLKPMKNV